METKLKKIMAAKGITQTRLAQLTGIDSSRVCRYANGSMNPSLRTVERFAAALGVEPSELMEAANG